jgi:hypothetical protein
VSVLFLGRDAAESLGGFEAALEQWVRSGGLLASIIDHRCLQASAVAITPWSISSRVATPSHQRRKLFRCGAARKMVSSRYVS